MTFPIDPHDNHDRRDKYRDEYAEGHGAAVNRASNSDREDHDPRHYRQDDEDRVQPEPREERSAHVVSGDIDHARYSRAESHEDDIRPDRYSREEDVKAEGDHYHDSLERPNENTAMVAAIHGNGDPPPDEGGPRGGEGRRDIHGSHNNLNGEKLEGGSEQEIGVSLFVRNVARHVMEDQLIALFSKYGKVHSAVVVRDPYTKECRGFGFVRMLSDEEAVQAIEDLRDFEFEGRRISVEKAKRKAPHSRTPGAYMGVDRRIRDRYVGMKRAREFDTGSYGGSGYYSGYGGGSYSGGYSSGYGGGYGGGGYGGGYGGAYPGGTYGHGDFNGMGRRDGFRGEGRGRLDERPGGWDQRPPHMRGPGPFDERERIRRRVDNDEARPERDYRIRDREPPVPREPTDDYV